MSGFEKFKEELLNKKQFYSLLMCKKLVTKSMSMFLRFAIDLKYLKTNVFLLADVLEKLNK